MSDPIPPSLDGEQLVAILEHVASAYEMADAWAGENRAPELRALASALPGLLADSRRVDDIEAHTRHSTIEISGGYGDVDVNGGGLSATAPTAREALDLAFRPTTRR